MNIKQISAVIILIFISTTNVYSQKALKKGSYSLSGSVSFSSGTNESNYVFTYENGDKSTYTDKVESLTFSFSPSLTYFFIDNLSAGLSISYGYYESTLKLVSTDLKNITRPISIGPIIRYYLPIKEFIPFVEASYKYSNSINGNEDMNSLSLAGGVNYFLSESVALEPYIEYLTRNYIVGNQKYTGFSIGMRVNYFIID